MSPLTNFPNVAQVTRVLAGRRLGPRMLVISLVLSGSVLGCHDLTGSQALPAGTQDPSYYNNAEGAVEMRNSAVVAFGAALPAYIVDTGLLTDELTDLSTITHNLGNYSGATAFSPLERRSLPELAYGRSGGYISDGTYQQLQGVRTVLRQAIGQLATYDTTAKDTTVLKPAAGRALRGELYALYGFAEIMLADFFCSGIPLSTLDFQHDFTYHGGDSTTQVYRDAIAQLDTALALSSDSTHIQNLARVGLGRAYLDLGLSVAAVDDVSSVPTEYLYQLSGTWWSNYLILPGYFFSVADNEGINGLPYLSGSDPRTADTTIQLLTDNTNNTYITIGFPRLYKTAITQIYVPITIASGVEARLIQAEAALHSGSGNALALLNSLRATSPIPGTTQPAQLPPLSDPGSDSAMTAVLFQERAAWLYLTGHRQGDLRRQLRQYPQYWPDQSQLYPTGAYSGLGNGEYGTDVTAPIPQAEYINPLFHGCLNRAP